MVFLRLPKSEQKLFQSSWKIVLNHIRTLVGSPSFQPLTMQIVARHFSAGICAVAARPSAQMAAAVHSNNFHFSHVIDLLSQVFGADDVIVVNALTGRQLAWPGKKGCLQWRRHRLRGRGCIVKDRRQLTRSSKNSWTNLLANYKSLDHFPLLQKIMCSYSKPQQNW